MKSPITYAESSSRAVPRDDRAGFRFIDWCSCLWKRHPALVTGLGLVALWQLGCSTFDVPTYLLPSPAQILEGFAAQPISTWALHTWTTFRVAMMGFGLAIAVSIPLAVMLVSSESLSRAVYPIIVAIQSVPIVAIAPIIIVVLGTSDLPRVVITFLITFFPIVVTTAAGLMATPPEAIELSRSLRAGQLRCMLHVRLPYAVPYIFSSLKVSVTLSLIGAVVAEFVAAERGLGYFIQFSTVYFKLNQAFGALLILVALNLTTFKAVGALQRLVAPWSLPKRDA